MKKVVIMLVCSMILLSGCNDQETLDVGKYSEYKCFDYHIACLDAYEQRSKTTIEYDGLKYTVWFRKPVGESDEQFICASVSQRHPLSSTEIVVMQNPTNYIDVFNDWTVKKIELYYEDLKNTKPLWNEDEPAKTPAKILATNTDSVVFDELIDCIINSDYSEKYTPQEDYTREIPNEDYVMFIRVHFNESENIVWDSSVVSYVSEQTRIRDVTIDKGRSPDGIAASNSLFVSIESFPNLSKWISTTIERFIDQ